MGCILEFCIIFLLAATTAREPSHLYDSSAKNFVDVYTPFTRS